MMLSSWAFEVAELKLANALPARWRHVQGVAQRARELRSVASSNSEADLLVAAALVHDVGYAPDIANTGFHPLDGANFLHDLGAPARLTHLVAHHSCATLEAKLRGLSEEHGKYHDERGVVRDALWYCDLTTSPNGERVNAQDRITEIKQRYGPEHLVTDFITRATPELLAALDRTEQRRQAALAPEAE